MGQLDTTSWLDPAEEESYWRQHYREEPYYDPGRDYGHYATAYRTGFEGRKRYEGKTFEEVEEDLEIDYGRHCEIKSPRWDEVREASRAAWERVDARVQSMTGN